MTDRIEQAVVDGACKALARRAATLRKYAGGLTTTTTDASGRTILILAPEAVVQFQNAALFERVAAELEREDRL